MTVRVLLFAVARQIVGSEEISLELPAGATIGQLRVALESAQPRLAPLLPAMAFAIGTDYAHNQSVIPADSVVACIPPTSGG